MNGTDDELEQGTPEDDPDGKTFSIFDRDIDEDLKLLDMRERIQAS